MGIWLWGWNSRQRGFCLPHYPSWIIERHGSPYALVVDVQILVIPFEFGNVALSQSYAIGLKVLNNIVFKSLKKFTKFSFEFPQPSIFRLLLKLFLVIIFIDELSLNIFLMTISIFNVWISNFIYKYIFIYLFYFPNSSLIMYYNEIFKLMAS